MSDTFDWVSARLSTTPTNAFGELRDHCEKMVEARKESLEGGDTGLTLEFKQGENSERFSVERSPARNMFGSTLQVTASVDLQEGHIRIVDHKHRRLDASPYMTKKGNLRFKINGDGSYKLWEVAQKMLASLFFDRHY